MHFSFLRKSHLLIPLAGLALAVTVVGDPPNRPAWWLNGNPPIITGTAENNKGPANIGQAKHMARSALLALRASGRTQIANDIEAALVGPPNIDNPSLSPPLASWAAPVDSTEQEKQKAPLLIGQLKAIAAPFYSRISASSPANASWLAAERTSNGTNSDGSIFPWTADPSDDQNQAIATIGQLKAVFSLRFENLPPTNLPPLNPDADTDDDGLTDGEEYLGGYAAGNRDSNNNGISDGYEDDDGDGYPNHIELKAGTDPRNPNSKPDGVSTDTLLVTNFSYTAKQRAASFSKAEFRAFVPTPVVNAKGLITSERYKFYNSRTIEQTLNQNSALTVTIAEDDSSQRTLKHDIIEEVFYNRSDTNEYFTGQLNNGSSEPGERFILKRVRSSYSEEGLFSKRSHDNGNTWGSDTDFSISGESVSDDLSFQKIKDEWTVNLTPFPNDGNGITYTNPDAIPDRLTTPTSMHPDLLSQTSEASQTVETQTSFSRSARTSGSNSGFEEVSTTMKTTLKDEFTDDAMIGLVKDVFNTKPYGEPSWSLKLESKYSLSDESDGGRAFTLSDRRYKLSTYVGPNIKKIVFLWKEITELDPAGMQDGSGAPSQTVQWKKETVINNSTSSYQKIETSEYLLSHPGEEGKRFVQGTVASSFLAPDFVRVDHDTKATDEVPSNLYGINFSVPADLIGQNVTLTSVGQGVVQLWEKVAQTYHKRPLPYTLQGEQKAGVGSSNGKFYIQGLVPGDLSLKLNSPLVLIAERGVAVVDLDVDVDSDNTGVIDHNTTEEERESLEGESGKIIFNLSRNDADNDGVPNFADLDNAGKFTPITLKTDNIDPSGRIQFHYSASPPSQVFTTTASDGSISYFPAPGLRVHTLMRIWTKDGDESRVLPDDFIKPERLYTLQELGMSPGSTKTFFVEAIHDSIGPAGIRVRASQGLEDRVMVNLLPVEVAPEVLAVNSDFDEGRIDPATGYAIPDCDDTDIALEAVRNHLDGKFAINDRVTDDMHPGFFGVNPSNLGDDFWAGANVTIRKIDKTDPATGHPESGHIRLYGKWGSGPSEYRAITPYDFETLATTNLATGGINGGSGESVYGAASPFPDGTSYFIEGVHPGKITLEWRYQKGSVDFKYEQKFEIYTKKSAPQWRFDLDYKIRLETSNDPSGEIRTIAYPLLSDGYEVNTERASEFYDFYRECFHEPLRSNPTGYPNAMSWPGLARLAGSQVIGGLSDSEWGRRALVGSILVPAVYPILNPLISGWSVNEIEQLQLALFQGGWQIFASAGWQHHAYRSSGYQAIEWVATETGDLDAPLMLPAWRDLHQGVLDHDKFLIDSASLQITSREQNHTIVPTWTVISGLGLGLVDDMFSILGTNSCSPAGLDFSDLFMVIPPPPVIISPGHLPFGNLANTADRWAWIQPATSGGILDTWNTQPMARKLALSGDSLRNDSMRFSIFSKVSTLIPILCWDDADVR